MPLLERKIYTIEVFMHCQKVREQNFIDGKIYYMAPPSRKHQDISGELYADIKSYIRSHGGDCKVYGGSFCGISG